MDPTRQLLSACEQGNLSVVENTLDQAKGLDVDMVDATGEDDTTALQVAAANGHEHVVRALLMRGAALDKYNTFGWTPLMHAARHGHLGVVVLLLQNQADINARTRLGVSALVLAARGGHLQTCKLLIEAGIDLTPSTGVGDTTCEFTPLMTAAHHGHDAVVRHLLDRGFDLNYRTPSTGINGLMVSALNGHMTTAQILIERGADPNHTNCDGHTPLDIATVGGKREVKGYLDRKTTNKPKVAPEDIKPDIIEAAKRGDLQSLKEILDQDLSQRDACLPSDGATPLMFAAMTGRLDMAQLLVEKGCDINKQDTVSGWTALMQATYHGKKAVAKLLINAGADVTLCAKNGCTAFDMASLIDDVDTELYRLLAAKALHVNRPDKGKKVWSSKQNGAAGTAGVEQGEAEPRSGLKAWWSRMSNRFRNLKLGRTFNFSTNRLAPLPSEVDDNDATLKSKNSPQTSASSSPVHEVRKAQSMDALADRTVTNITINSYETFVLETKKTASLYTLGINAQNSTLTSGTLKPVIPPFLPPPTFETDRTKMPPTSNRRSNNCLDSNSTLTRPIKFIQSYSTSNLSTRPVSPGGSARPNDNPSPSSSGGASSIGTVHQSVGPSSASSSTLTAGSDNLHKHGVRSGRSQSDSVFLPVSNRPPTFLTATSSSMYTRNQTASQRATFLRQFSTTSPSSSTSDGSSFTLQKPYHTKSGSSRESTSTLTPSPSPTPKVPDGSGQSSDSQSASSQRKSSSDDDDLGGILKKLSLERYQPIFEQQEVDMEAFLTLTDKDLKELGISHTQPRRQILAAITELQSGKGRERQHFHETMTSFQSAMTSRNRLSSGSEGMSIKSWDLAEEDTGPMEVSTKSRSS